MAVHHFGTKPRSNKVAFYHGISRRLIFPMYISEQYKGLQIQCPLSTSLSFTVASNFANDNEGIVIQFQLTAPWKQMSHYYSKEKIELESYFSCDWLSDFGNEKECLFLQMRFGMNINNIIDMKSTTEYKTILYGLKKIKTFLECKTDESNTFYSNPYDLNKKKANDEYFCDGFTKALMKCIVLNQLSYTHSMYQSYAFSSLSGHAKTICKTALQHCKDIKIRYKFWREYNDELFKVLRYSECGCINLNLVNMLCSNMISIQIEDDNKQQICPKLLHHVYDFFNKQATTAVKHFTFTANYNNCKEYLNNMINVYSSSYSDINLRLWREDHTLYAWKCTVYEFIVTLFGTYVFQEPKDFYIGNENKTTHLLLDLINNQLLISNNFMHIEEKHSDQLMFQHFCSEKTQVLLHWNHDAYLFSILLYHSKCEYLNLYILISLFPNMEKLRINYFGARIDTFCKQINHILEYFKKTRNCNISEIIFTFNEEYTSQHIDELVNRYACSFDKNNVLIYRTMSDISLHIIHTGKVEYNQLFRDIGSNIGTILFSLLKTLTEEKLRRMMKVSSSVEPSVDFEKAWRNQPELHLDCRKLILHRSCSLFKILFHSESLWVNWNTISRVFVKLERIDFFNAYLSSKFFNDILLTIKSMEDVSMFPMVTIKASATNVKQMKNIVDTYAKPFAQQTVLIYLENEFVVNIKTFDAIIKSDRTGQHNTNRSINISNSVNYLVQYLLDNLGNIYIGSEQTQIDSILHIKQLVKNELSEHVVSATTQHAFHDYCAKKTTFAIRWNPSKPSILPFISKHIQLTSLFALFPHLQTLSLKPEHFSPSLLEDILKYFGSQSIKIQCVEIIIKVDLRTADSMKHMFEMYFKQFETYGIFMYERDGDNGEHNLYLKKQSAIDFIIYSMDNYCLNGFKCNMNDSETVKYMDQLIGTEISMPKVDINNSQNNDIIKFHEYCTNKKHFKLKLKPNVDSYLFALFFNEKFKWIKLDKVIKLYPNLEKVSIHFVFDLFQWMLDDIINYLNIINTKTKINTVKFLVVKVKDKLDLCLHRSQFDVTMKEADTWWNRTELTEFTIHRTNRRQDDYTIYESYDATGCNIQ
eukprot:307365_1